MNNLHKIIVFLALVLCAVAIVPAQDSEREKGIELYNAGEYQKAAEILQKAVATNKEDYQSWLYLGMSQARQKNNKQAVKAFNQADKIFAKNEESPSKLIGVKITSKPRAPYTDAARQNSTQGEIKIAVEFGADGRIKAIVPFKTLPDGLTDNCVEAAKKVKFDPAVKDGKTYSTIGILSYRFTIY